MKVKILNVINHYQKAGKKPGSLIVVKIGDEEKRIWHPNVEYRPVDETVEIADQLDDKGKPNGFYQIMNNFTLKEELEMREMAKFNAIKAVFSDAKELFRL